MTLKYEILKRLVKAADLKNAWVGKSTEELLENRRKAYDGVADWVDE